MKMSYYLLIGLIIATAIIICPISAGPVGPGGGNWALYKPDQIFPGEGGAPPLPTAVTGARPLLVILIEASDDAPNTGNDATFYSNLVTGAGGLNDYYTGYRTGTSMGILL
jgi:hypothetical protein